MRAAPWPRQRRARAAVVAEAPPPSRRLCAVEARLRRALSTASWSTPEAQPSSPSVLLLRGSNRCSTDRWGGRRRMALSEGGRARLTCPPPRRRPHVPVLSGNLLYVSGRSPSRTAPHGEGPRPQKSTSDRRALARQCAIQGLGIARYLARDRVTSSSGLRRERARPIDHPRVVNGASALIDVFGDAGRHARCAVGMAEHRSASRSESRG
jgi:hypothetical protein